MRLAVLALAVFLCGQPAVIPDEAHVCKPEASPLADYVITAPSIEHISKNQVVASGGVTIASREWTLRADDVRGDIDTQSWTATGNVRFERPGSELFAESAVYDAREGFGELTQASGRYEAFRFRGSVLTLSPERIIRFGDAFGSTCTLDRPHWSISARSLEVFGAETGSPGARGLRVGGVTIESKYAVARDLRVKVGNTTIFGLPKYRFRLDRRAASLLPTPGFDKRDGFYLKYRHPVQLSWASAASVSGCLTQRNGVLWGLDLERSLDGGPTVEEVREPRPEVTNDLTSLTLLTTRPDRRSLLPDADETEVSTAGVPERSSHLFLRLAHKQRVFDPDIEYLHVDRLPEFGVRLSGLRIGRLGTPGNPFVIDTQASMGRFRERPDKAWHSRFDARAVARLNTNIGTHWLVEPALFARFSAYSGGDTQQILAGSLAIGREISKNYFASLTYVRHMSSGRSPFEFDDLDVKAKLATRLEADMGKTRGSLTLDFDLERGGVYDWTLSVAHVFHCIEPRINYQNRYRDFSVGFAFVVPR